MPKLHLGQVLAHDLHHRIRHKLRRLHIEFTRRHLAPYRKPDYVAYCIHNFALTKFTFCHVHLLILNSQ